MSDVQGAETPPENAPNEAEARARRLGWVAKDEFRGDPEHWRDADEFLKRGETILPLALRNNDRLQRRLDTLETELRETKESAKALVEFTSKSEQRAYERAKREIEAGIEQAAANADAGAVRTQMERLDALNKEYTPEPAKKTETQQQTIQIDPEIQDWITKETWFNRDRALNGYAIDQFETIQRDKPGLTTAEVLAETKRRAVEKFPEKFGINPNRENAAAVASPSGGNGATRKNAKNYDNLPPDAKKACDKFVKTIPGYTKEKYCADYDWEA
jgi:hypothetical protein